MQKPYTVTLNLYAEASFIRLDPRVIYVAGDREVYPVEIRLRDGTGRPSDSGKPFRLPPDAVAMLTFTGGSGFVWQDAAVIADAAKGIVTYDIPAALLKVPPGKEGGLRCSVSVSTAERRLTWPSPFEILVRGAKESGGTLPPDPPPGMGQILAEHDQRITANAEDIAELDIRVTALEQAGPGGGSGGLSVYRKDFAATDWGAYLTYYSLTIPASAHLRGVSAAVLELRRNKPDGSEPVLAASKRYVTGDITVFSDEPFDGSISIL
ncbi:MAG: phage baseplate upper protein [Defluviitaleaceae bacterium]|nr:phage baseplate upper protein [Defluviitaleaceae bacterium]